MAEDPRREEGATPPGAVTGEQAGRWVRHMFDTVAPRYDLLNRLLSFRADVYWRRRTARRLRGLLEEPGARVLDLCCGTGDLLLELEERAGRGTHVYGSDFSRSMLEAARRKIAQKQGASVLFRADALRLPLPRASFDLVTLAFGFRNLSDYRQGLDEMRRILKPGGTLAILEFSHPPNRAFRALYEWYSRHVLPAVGGAVSGSREAYAYLQESVGRFPDAPALAARMRERGFAEVDYTYLTAGIVALHTGRAPAPDC